MEQCPHVGILTTIVTDMLVGNIPSWHNSSPRELAGTPGSWLAPLPVQLGARLRGAMLPCWRQQLYLLQAMRSNGKDGRLIVAHSIWRF